MEKYEYNPNPMFIKSVLVKHFNIQEMNTALYNAFGKTTEDFGGSGKEGKAFEIATWTNRYRNGHILWNEGLVRARPHLFKPVGDYVVPEPEPMAEPEAVEPDTVLDWLNELQQNAERTLVLVAKIRTAMHE